MPELRDLLGDLAGSPAPPSRLAADDLFATGQRQRRRRQRTVAAAGVAASLVLVMVAVIAWRPFAGDESAPDVATSTSTSAAPSRVSTVVWAATSGTLHGYVQVMACSPASVACPKTNTTLLGTDDGGTTWTERGQTVDGHTITLLQKSILLASAYPVKDDVPVFLLSVDGGRTWDAVRDGQPAVADVPDGAVVICHTGRVSSPCRLSAVDVTTGRMSPLIRQPELIMATVVNVVNPAGRIGQAGDRIWISGTDPATGRAAVATSVDRGRTWARHIFTDLPCGNDCDQVLVWPTVDGSVAHAVVEDADRRRAYVYRQQVPGSWVRAGDVLRYGEHERYQTSVVTADGTHVIGLASDPPTESGVPATRYVAVDRDAYRAVHFAGLPATAIPATRTGGTYHAYDHTTKQLFRSFDGRTWTRFPTP